MTMFGTGLFGDDTFGGELAEDGGTMPNALEYLHALAEETGEYGLFLTTSVGTTTTVVCSRLANSNLSATEFANMYVLIETGAAKGEMGQIRGGGLNRATGTITVGDTFSAAIGSGVTFSLYRLLPPIGGDTVIPSDLQVVNWALHRIPMERTLSFDGVTDQKYYTIDRDTYPWFTDTERIMWVEWPVTTVGDIPRRMQDTEWEWDVNGPIKRLYFRAAPFRTGETFGIKVMAPGNSLIRQAGTWLEQDAQSSGMVLFTGGIADEGMADVNDVVTMGSALMFRALSRINQPTADIAEWLAKMQPSMVAAKMLQQTGVAEDRTTATVKLRPTVMSGFRRRRFDGRNLY